MLKDYFKLAWGSLLHRKLRSWLTMIGIFIGVASIVALISLGQGLEDAIVGQFSVFGTDVVSVTARGSSFGPPGTGVIEPLTQENVDRINQIGGVDIAIGRIIEQGKIEFNDKVAFGMGMNIPDGRGRKAVEEILNLEVEKGRLLKDGDRRKLLIGSNLGSDDMAEFLGKKLEVGSNMFVQDEEFEIIGILEKKGSFLIDGALFFNEEDLRDLYDRPRDEYSVIGVRVQNIDYIPEVKADIEKYLRRARDVDEGEEDFAVETPENAINNLKDTLFAITLFLYIIAGISLVVGGIGITNTMYTAVLERTKEIGIMKAIGASNKSIFAIFSIESGLLGIVGGIIGVLFGMGIAQIVAVIGKMALGELIGASFSPLIIFGALAFSFIVGMIAGVFPAIQAAKLHPVDALNYAK